MWDLEACIVCFTTDKKLYSLNLVSLRQNFNLISGLKTSCENGMPDYLCFECLAYVKKFVQFREKCQRAYYALQCIIDVNNEIKTTDLKAINCSSLNIMPSLSYIDLNNAHYEQVVYQSTKDSSYQYGSTELIPIFNVSTLTTDDTFELVIHPSNEVKVESNIKKKLLELVPSMDDTEVINMKIENSIDLSDNYDDDDDYELNYAIKDSSLVADDSNIVDDSIIVEDSNIVADIDNNADGVTVEKYANIIPLTVNEAKAAMEINKYFMTGDFKCHCGWATNNEERLTSHSRIHDKHISGNFHCDICDYYYKTDFLLQTHISMHHKNKYVCRLCYEVNFDRISARQHHVVRHKQTSLKVMRHRKKRKAFKSGYAKGYSKGVKEVPKNFLATVPVTPLEQYEMIEMRKLSKNYTTANYKCELCYRGFRTLETYKRHMVKHDSSVSGDVQCDMCKLFFPDTRKLYIHMNTNHLNKYLCKLCKFNTPNRHQALMHYRWHKNVTYDCQHCGRKFLKLSTRLTHIRLKHPSTFMCNLCGHSFVSLHGLTMHKRMAHFKKDSEGNKALKTETKSYYCEDCEIDFLNEEAFATHLISSSKHVDVNIACLQTEKSRTKSAKSVRPRGRKSNHTDIHNIGVPMATKCELCDEILANDVQTRKHYETEHPGTDYLKRYMCDICGHTTKQYSNLISHMRTHTREKPYQCQHCERRFSMPSNRDRHLLTHTGEKPYECQHCYRRFSQSSAMKLHVQTVHLKIPYAPWDKKKRKRRKEMEPSTADVNIVAPQLPCLVQPQPKLLIDNQGDYINAYITYADE